MADRFYERLFFSSIALLIENKPEVILAFAKEQKFDLEGWKTVLRCLQDQVLITLVCFVDDSPFSFLQTRLNLMCIEGANNLKSDILPIVFILI